MNWGYLKNDSSELLEQVNQSSARSLARRLGKSHTTIIGLLNKFGYFYNGECWVKKNEEAGEKKGTPERVPKKQDLGDYWTISSGGRSFKISKQKYRDIRRDYTGQNYLTINQICRKHQLPRWKFMILKTPLDSPTTTPLMTMKKS